MMANANPPVVAPVINQPVIISQPIPGGYGAPTSTGSVRWSTGIMAMCDDIGICLFGCFCPCCLAAQVAHAFGECFILGCMPCAHCALRTGIRERYTIPGSLINDCCVMTFCNSCAICQMQREIKIRTMLVVR
ncbi:cornifelin homolog [Polypterus senegalus]|uniref:cornifelin homolog n=1 Tax=Polypterus senegalus TaxID=55291 RepID=UPI001962D6B4|nr:cornifelin homolog [Polypterus senegalus]